MRRATSRSSIRRATRVDLDKAPYSQEQFGATLGGPIRRDKTLLLRVGRAARHRASNLVTIDDRTVVTHPFTGAPLGTPAQILRTRRVSGRDRQRGLRGHDRRSSWSRSIISSRRTRASRCGSTTRDALNENIEPFGGITRAQPRRRARCRDYVFAARTPSVFRVTLGQRAALSVRVSRSARASLDPAAAAMPDRRPGRADARGHGLRQRRPPALHAADADATRCSVRSTPSAFDRRRTCSRPASIFNLDRATCTEGPRCRCTSAAATSSSSCPPIPGAWLPGAGAPRFRRSRWACRRPTSRATASTPITYNNSTSRVVRAGRLAPGDRSVTLKYGLRYQNQFWPRTSPTARRAIQALSVSRPTATTSRRAWRFVGSRRRSQDLGPRRVRPVLREPHHGARRHHRPARRRRPRPHARADVPRLACQRVERARPQPAGIGRRNVPDAEVPHRSRARIALRAPRLGRRRSRACRARSAVSASFVYARGFNQVGTIDYNPVVPALGAGRRPQDVNGVAGTSASILQYTTFGETWYKGSPCRSTSAISESLSVPCRATRCRRPRTTRPTSRARSSRSKTAAAATRATSTACPSGSILTASAGPRRRISGIASSSAASTPRPVDVQLSSIVTVGSGRPYTILAGADLNGDGNGGAFPPDRARRDPTERGVERRPQFGNDALAGERRSARQPPLPARRPHRTSKASSRSSTCSIGRTSSRPTI